MTLKRGGKFSEEAIEGLKKLFKNDKNIKPMLKLQLKEYKIQNRILLNQNEILHKTQKINNIREEKIEKIQNFKNEKQLNKLSSLIIDQLNNNLLHIQNTKENRINSSFSTTKNNKNPFINKRSIKSADIRKLNKNTINNQPDDNFKTITKDNYINSPAINTNDENNQQEMRMVLAQKNGKFK